MRSIGAELDPRRARNDSPASMFCVVPRVRYGRLPGDNGTALRGLGPPFSHIKTVSSATLCKSASIVLNRNRF